MAAGDPAHPHLHPGCPPQNSRRVREIKTPRQQTRRDRAQALATGQKAVGRQRRVHGRPQAAAQQGGAHAGRRRHQQRDQGVYMTALNIQCLMSSFLAHAGLVSAAATSMDKAAQEDIAADALLTSAVDAQTKYAQSVSDAFKGKTSQQTEAASFIIVDLK